MRLLLLTSLAFIAIVSVPPVARGQWVTETYNLKAGWNAVYLHIDASYETLNQLVGLDQDNPIQEIWMWAPPGFGVQFLDSPQAPTHSGSEWLRWNRDLAGASPLQRLSGNVACLVRVSDDVPAYAWTLTGRPLPPIQAWTGSGLNFIGFPTPKAQPPTWGDFLGPSRTLHNHAEVYRYVGGPLSETNPQRLWPSLLRNTLLNRNEAYWVRAEEYNRYFGPFEVKLQTPSGIGFGTSGGQFRMHLRNTIDETVTVTAGLLPSEAPPPGEESIAGLVPLLLRGEVDMSDLTHGFTRLADEGGEWTLQPKGEPGDSAEIILGLERLAMNGDAGDLFAGILRFTDSAGLIEVDLPVSAEVASAAGLWVGNALIGEVAHRLVTYAEDDDGELVQNEDGSYIVAAMDDSFGAVARPFPLRLIVHNDGENGATLLQRIYYGPSGEENLVLAKSQDALNPAALDSARRISVAHLPWTENNISWPFNGPLGEGAEIEVTVNVPYDDQATNPFLHTYHPDHDNFDARFEQTLPEGVESYGIQRRITLRVQPPGGDFSSVTAGSGALFGSYEETITLRGRGGASREYRTRGGFSLIRVVEISTLTP